MLLFDAQKLPYRGFRSYPVGHSLPPGIWKLGRNVRSNDGSLRLRDGYFLDAGMGTLPAGTFRGGTIYFTRSITLVGVERTLVIVGMEIGGVVKLYQNQWLSGAWTGWLEVTQSSGKHGNTEMDPDFNGYLDFQYIPPRKGLRLSDTQHRVIVQNGVDSPRIVDGEIAWFGAESGQATKTIAAIPAPKVAQGHVPVAYIPNILNLSETAGGSVTITASGAVLTGSVQGTAAGGYYWRASIGAAPHTDGDTLIMRLGTTQNWSGSRQLILLATPDDDSWLSCVKIEVENNGSYYTVHDPENLFQSMIEVYVNHNTIRCFAFPLEDHAASLTAVRGLRFTVTRGTNAGTPQSGLTPSTNFDIFMVAGSGKVPGGAHYGISWFGKHTTAESPGVLMRYWDAADNTTVFRKVNPANAKRDALLRKQGFEPKQGTQMDDVLLRGARVPANFKFPLDPQLYYNYKVPIFSPDSTTGGVGRIDCNVYRKDPGESNYYLVAGVQTNDYTGSPATWSYASPFTAWDQKQYYTDSTTSEARTSTVVIPSAYNLPVPRGRGMLLANRRLHVVAVNENSAGVDTPDVYVSDQDFAYRFRSVPVTRGDFDPSGGFTHQISNDNINALVASSASMIGASNVYAFGDKGLYSLDGFEMRQIGSIGSKYPQTIAERNGNIYFVDPEMHVRLLGSGVQSLSGDRVQDILDDVPASRRILMSGAWFRDRYYLARSASGGTDNRRVLVYSEKLGEWESDDLCADISIVPEQFVVWSDSEVNKLCFFAGNGRLYHYERPSQTVDNTSQINFRLESWGIHEDGYTAILFGESRVLCDDKNSETMTVTRNIMKPLASVSGTLSLDAGGSETSTWRHDVASDHGGSPAGSGVSATYQFDATLAGPFKVYRLEADVIERNRGAD